MSTKTIKASAPGKIHFIGEHTAVYFKPAILAAVNLRCNVTLEPSENKKITISSKNFNASHTFSYDEIIEFTDKAQQTWEEYRKYNDLSVLKSIIKSPTDYPALAVGETLTFFNEKIPNGFHLTIDSQLPVGSGLGTSATVSVTVVAVVSKFLGRDLDVATLRSIAIRVEQKMHGNPTFGDISTVINGGLIWFRKESPKKLTIRLLSFSVPKKLSVNMILLQSGVPEETTGEMVHSVAAYRKDHPERFEQVLDRQGALTVELSEAIKSANESALIRIMKAAEKNLETIGVVSESTKKLIREIEQAGGAAKICGAGGQKKGSGVILAYHKDRNIIESLANAKKLEYYPVELGGKGLEIQ